MKIFKKLYTRFCNFYPCNATPFFYKCLAIDYIENHATEEELKKIYAQYGVDFDRLAGIDFYDIANDYCCDTS